MRRGPVSKPELLLRASVGSTEATKDDVARFGAIDRRIGEPPCARRCRRTDARKKNGGGLLYGIILNHPIEQIFAPMLHKGLGLRLAPWMRDAAEVGACVGLIGRRIARR
jgi:hypothetical protein